MAEELVVLYDLQPINTDGLTSGTTFKLGTKEATEILPSWEPVAEKNLHAQIFSCKLIKVNAESIAAATETVPALLAPRNRSGIIGAAKPSTLSFKATF